MQNISSQKEGQLCWTSSFDLQIPCGSELVNVPGDELHVRLQRYENMFRTYYECGDQIFQLELDMGKLQENIAVRERDELTGNTPQKKIEEATVKVLQCIFTGRPGKHAEAYRKDFCELIYAWLRNPENSNINIREVALKLSCASTGYVSVIDSFEKEYSLQMPDRMLSHGKKKRADPQRCRLFLRDMMVVSQRGKACDLGELLTETEKKLKARKGQVSLAVKNAIKDYRKICVQYAQSVEQMQEALRKKNNELQAIFQSIVTPKITNQAKKSTNFVVAQIGFVVEMAENKARRFVSFPIAIPRKNTHNIYDLFRDDYAQFMYAADRNKVVRDSVVDRDILKRQMLPRDQHSSILKRGTYAQDFYHSEQDLCAYLEQPGAIKHIVERLHRMLGSQKVAAVHYVVLDLHSTRYMCNHCQRALWYMQQRQKGFLKQLQGKLCTQLNVSFGETLVLKMMIRVSADVPHPTEKNVVSMEKHEKIGAWDANHAQTIFTMDSCVVPLCANLRLEEEGFQEGLHRHTVLSSGGEAADVKFFPVFYNRLVWPVKEKAARVIWKGWKRHKQKEFVQAATGISKVAIEQNWSEKVQCEDGDMLRASTLKNIFSFFSVPGRTAKEVQDKGIKIHDRLADVQPKVK